MPKFFRFPFGVDGDRAAIPETIQPSGDVSYQEGFGFDYERELGTDPSAKAVPRDESNELYFNITENIQQYQTHGVPEFITASDNGGSPYPYPILAKVRYNDGTGVDIYTSLVNSNTALPSDPVNWRKGEGAITNLIGDVVANGPGVTTATIQSNAVTTSKIAAQAVTLDRMQHRAANTVLANPTATAGELQAVALPQSTILGRGSTGNISPLTIGTGLAVTGTVLSNPGTPALPNSVIANPTASSAVPTSVQLTDQKRLIGRGATGNISQISLGDNLDMAASVLNVISTSSAANNGYFRVPGTQILVQWGRLTNVQLNQSFHNVTFPIQFPNAVYNILASISMTNIVSGSISTVIRKGQITLSGFPVAGDNAQQTSVGDIYWLAIGR